MEQQQKLWSEHSDSQKSEILAELRKIYAEHGHPEWLEQPNYQTQVVNDLTRSEQTQQSWFRISGKSGYGPETNQIITEVSRALKSVKDTSIWIEQSTEVGSKLGPITSAMKVLSNEVATIEHSKDEVILLDFWATWCPPCQRPMAHNQEMLEKRGKDWGKRVRLIGLSIDRDCQTVTEHVKAKKWTSVEHYHVKGEGCTATKDWQIRGVPHICLVDTEGTIVFRGHPMERSNLEEDIDRLLQGKKIQGAPPAVKQTSKPKYDHKKYHESESQIAEIVTKFARDTK